MERRDLCAAAGQTPAARLFDQFPGAPPRRVPERAPAGAFADRLVLVAGAGDLRHPGGYRRAGSGFAPQHRLDEDPPLRHRAGAIAQTERRRVEPMNPARPVDRFGRDDDVGDLPAVRARVHAERAADRARIPLRNSRPAMRHRAPRAPPTRPSPRRPPVSAFRCTRSSRMGRPRRIVTPGIPPSRTSRFEPTPITVTAISGGNASRNRARSRGPPARTGLPRGRDAEPQHPGQGHVLRRRRARRQTVEFPNRGGRVNHRPLPCFPRPRRRAPPP